MNNPNARDNLTAPKFQPGVSGNPGGKTSKQRQMELSAATIAAEARLKMLSTMLEKIEGGEDPLNFLNAATLKLFKDSEDRAHGTPKQSVDHTSGGDAIAALRAYIQTGKDVGDP